MKRRLKNQKTKVNSINKKSNIILKSQKKFYISFLILSLCLTLLVFMFQAIKQAPQNKFQPTPNLSPAPTKPASHSNSGYILPNCTLGESYCSFITNVKKDIENNDFPSLISKIDYVTVACDETGFFCGYNSKIDFISGYSIGQESSEFGLTDKNTLNKILKEYFEEEKYGFYGIIKIPEDENTKLVYTKHSKFIAFLINDQANDLRINGIILGNQVERL